MAKARASIICSRCNSEFEPGKRCCCVETSIDANAIPQSDINRMARPALAAARNCFEDPDFRAGFEKWLADRESKAARAMT